MKQPYLRIQQPTLHRLITVVNNTVNFTPKLLIKNGVGSWSADNLPSGIVFNSLTGAISGVLTKTGCNFVHLTYTEGECKDTVIVPIYTVDKIVSIPSGYYKSAILLDEAPYRCYRLSGDVVFDKSAFLISNIGAVLALNGHSITYDNKSSPIILANGNFNTGNASGWNLNNATGAYVATGSIKENTALNDGENVLCIPMQGQTKYIETKIIYNITSGECYAVSMLPLVSGTEGVSTNLVISLGSHTSSKLLGQDEFDNRAEIWREGGFAIWTFKAHTTEKARLRITVSNVDSKMQYEAPSKDRVFCLSRINVDRARCHGIMLVSSTANCSRGRAAKKSRPSQHAREWIVSPPCGSASLDPQT